MDLVIMAAGLGSRFGSLKQMQEIDKDGNFIIDYSVFDAIKAGFDRVVFIIREDFADAFKKSIGARVEKFIPVAYAYQNNENIPEGVQIPETRKKPLGTAHAILCAKDVIKNNKFAIINADDFYGEQAFKTIAGFLRNSTSQKEYAIVGYRAKNTLSEKGSVKRGILSTDANGNLTDIDESIIDRINIKDETGKVKDYVLTAQSISNNKNGEVSEIDKNTLVSMNMIGFKPSIFKHLEESFLQFFYFNQDDLDRAEFLIPDVIELLVREGKINVKVPETSAKWQGITYKEDLENLQEHIKNEKYPEKLWDTKNFEKQ